jgi:cyclohexyl-isocyanide hydratase
VVAHGNLYTAGPGVGSFEAVLLVAEAAYGRGAAEMAELVMEYDPHPPFGVGAVNRARREQVAHFEGLMSHMVAEYRTGAVGAFQTTST